MNAIILSIGDEIVSGVTLDTNSAWLAQRFAERGITTLGHHSLGDDQSEIVDVVRTAMGKADLVVSTGGLGPTKDDLTRDALAEALDEPLIEDPEALAWLKAWFAGRSMMSSNLTQAMRPASMRCLKNPVGTAPALALMDAAAVRLVALPGPPHEMKRVFAEHEHELFAASTGRVVRRGEVVTYGLGESAIGERIADLMERGRSPAVGTTAHRGLVTCRIRAESDSADHAEAMVRQSTETIRDRLGLFVLDDAGAEGSALAGDVLARLRAGSRTLCTVESCTGGMIGEMLTSVPGSSAAYLGGWVTYANELKTYLVGVDPDALELGGPGAVSAEVASMMAEGGRARSGGSLAVSVSGVAGPEGGTEAKPVGTVWIAIADSDGTEARRFLFRGDREGVRRWAAIAAIGMVRNRLLGISAPLVGELERRPGR